MLGVVEAWIDGRPADLGHSRQRSVLGVLLVEAGRPVTPDQLIDRVWGERAPQRAAGALYSYLSRLRRAVAGAEDVEIRREPGGYLLTVNPQVVDLHRFRRLMTTARSAETDRSAAGLIEQALGLWRGDPFAGLDTPWMAAMRRTLLGERLAAELDGNDVLLRLGRHGELLPSLLAAVAEHPLDERLAGQAMLALYRGGRQADADEQYRRIRHRLADEMGSDPGAELRRLHEQVLAADPALSVVAGDLRAPAGPVTVAPATVPAQLPADVRAFTGRTGELSALDRLLEPLDGGEPPLTVALLCGTAGVGKSALAVRWAHRVREAYPDGQLYVNLRGYDAEQPVAVADALAGFLTALGVRGPEIPPGTDERAARYRSELTGRRMLVLLDNASSVEQVRPLLPGTGSCLVLITSRDSLRGMVAVDGAERVNLDLLPLADAIGLLRKLIGPRVDRDPDAAAALAAACARLPLALRIAAELAAERSDVPLPELVAELGDHQMRLDLLDAGGDPRAEVRAVFSWSYQNLPEGAARAFRLLGLHPGETAHVDAVAALIGARPGETRRLLDVLTRASLVQAGRGGRYGMHDLLSAYAAELADGNDSEADRQAAVTRLFDHYLTSATVAMATLYPDGAAAVPAADGDPGAAAAAGDPDTARAWLEAERPNLAAVCTNGAAHGWHRHAIDLAGTMFRYLDAGGPVAEASTVTASAVAAARAIGDTEAQARALSNLGRLHRRQGRLPEAAETYRQALRLYAALGEPEAEALVLRNLGSVDWRRGDYRQAAEHYQRAGALCQELGDDAGRADAVVRLGLIDARLGDGKRAAERFGTALDLYAALGDRFSEAYVLSLLARLPHHPVPLEQAEAHLDQSLAAVQRAGDRTAEAYVLTDLAAIHVRQGRLAEAAAHLRRALVLLRRIGDRASEAEALNDLGQVLHAVGEAAEARAQHGQALMLAEDFGDRYEQARAHDGIAAASGDLGEPDPARAHLDLAGRILAELEVPADQSRWTPSIQSTVTGQPRARA